MQEMLDWCDSIEAIHTFIIDQKDLQLDLKGKQIDKQEKIISFTTEQIGFAEKQGKKFKRQRNVFIGSTAFLVLLTIIAST